MNKVYLRGLIGQKWYNFTEFLVYGLSYKKNPYNLFYYEKVKYGADKLQYVNIYQNKDNKKRPLLIYIHGGSWVSGITEMRNQYIMKWAERGFNTASISYSYAPQKVYPFQLQEMFDAVDFLYDNKDKYNFDFDNIVLAGESAGGYFVSYLASVLSDTSSLEKLGLTFRNIKKLKVKALVTLSGCYDLKRLSDKSNPQSYFPDLKTMIKSYLGMSYDKALAYINSEDGKYISPQVNSSYPPSFLVWGDKDLLRYESFDFAEQLEENNVPYRLYKADGLIGMHAWSLVMLFKKSRETLDEVFKYVIPMIDFN
ncbi:MAG: alpha/beta hydrolase [Clostridia bacterium]|nr:alpha/beta hydrolase [Clostridia bacterium]